MHASIIDCHTHTNFSDGESSFEENVRAAAARGCRVLVSTDHLIASQASMDPRCECQVPARDLPAIQAASCRARTCGAIAPDHGFHFWILNATGTRDASATSHSGRKRPRSSLQRALVGDAGDTSIAAGERGCERIDPADEPGLAAGWIDYSEDMHIWEELGAGGVWRAYVDAWCSRVRSPLAFDSMAHPDLLCAFRKMDGRHPRTSKAFGTKWPRARTTRIAASSYLPRHFAKGCPTTTPPRACSSASSRPACPSQLAPMRISRVTYASAFSKPKSMPFAAGYRTFDVPRADGSWESWNL